MAIKVIVLCGGDSPEREVSLRSGAEVARALAENGYQVAVFDPAAQGGDYEWHLKHADVVFPVLHGVGGEDGSIQQWLEDRNIRYIGSDAASSRVCFDKWSAKQLYQANGIPTPGGEVVNSDTFWNSPHTQSPFVLKPLDGGSSIDTFIIRDISTFEHKPIDEAFSRHPNMLLEELIDGEEITCGILLNEALPVIEIIPPSDGEFDYDNKYNGKTLELCPPQSISREVQKQAQDLAIRVHQVLKVRDISRTDMIVAEDNSLWVLETNTIPGLTAQSLIPKAAAAAGYGMNDLVRVLVEEALKR
jgi:D-alanine-D-alanine ligase